MMKNRHAKRGRNNVPAGEFHHAAKLTEPKVRELRRLYYDDGLCAKCTCLVADVPYKRGQEAILFYTWKHVGPA